MTITNYFNTKQGTEKELIEKFDDGRVKSVKRYLVNKLVFKRVWNKRGKVIERIGQIGPCR